MTMMSEEEFLRKSVKKAVSNTIQTLFRTREFSKNFLGRKDNKNVDKEINSAAEKVTGIIIERLKSERLLGKQVTQEHFSEIYKSALDEYLGRVSSDRSTVHAK
jgi:hypothetical protein